MQMEHSGGGAGTITWVNPEDLDVDGITGDICQVQVPLYRATQHPQPRNKYPLTGQPGTSATVPGNLTASSPLSQTLNPEP